MATEDSVKFRKVSGKYSMESVLAQTWICAITELGSEVKQSLWLVLVESTKYNSPRAAFCTIAYDWCHWCQLSLVLTQSSRFRLKGVVLRSTSIKILSQLHEGRRPYLLVKIAQDLLCPVVARKRLTKIPSQIPLDSTNPPPGCPIKISFPQSFSTSTFAS